MEQHHGKGKKHGWGKRRLGMAIYGNFACDEYEITSQL
jgi:hypothetical protein